MLPRIVMKVCVRFAHRETMRIKRREDARAITGERGWGRLRRETNGKYRRWCDDREWGKMDRIRGE